LTLPLTEAQARRVFSCFRDKAQFVVRVAYRGLDRFLETEYVPDEKDSSLAHPEYTFKEAAIIEAWLAAGGPADWQLDGDL